MIEATGAFVRDAVERDLTAAGFNRPDRIYAVYYDGSSTDACGGAFWPPAIAGNAVVMYLRGTPNCNQQRPLRTGHPTVVLGVRDAPRHPARARDRRNVRALRPVAASFAGSAARCRWRLPANAKGKRLTATVTAVAGSLSATPSFARVVR